MTPIDRLVNYITTRYATNESFENLVNSLKEEQKRILEFEKEDSYQKGYNDGFQQGWNDAGEVKRELN